MKRLARSFTPCVLVLVCAAGAVGAADAPTPPKLPDQPFTGEFVGTFTPDKGEPMTGVAKVNYDPRIKPSGGYRATVYAVVSGLIDKAVVGEKTVCPLKISLSGTAVGDKAELEGRNWKAVVTGETFTAKSKAGTFALKRHERKSPTLLAKPPHRAVVLLPYEKGKAPSLDAWTNKKWKVANDGSMTVVPNSGNNLTAGQFKNFRLHAEFAVSDKAGGNSGFYLLDRYEVQVLNTFGRGPLKHGCAAIYQTFAPSADASLPVGQWQTYDITFHAPVMEGKEVKKRPRITVVHNGVTVHDDIEIPHATGNARPRGDTSKGPIVLQDHKSPARYRNIWLVELDGGEEKTN